jgi:hypothetical protein
MKSTEKFNELKEFLLYQCTSNPLLTLKDVQPQLNELLRRIGEPKVTVKDK